MENTCRSFFQAYKYAFLLNNDHNHHLNLIQLKIYYYYYYYYYYYLLTLGETWRSRIARISGKTRSKGKITSFIFRLYLSTFCEALRINHRGGESYNIISQETIPWCVGAWVSRSSESWADSGSDYFKRLGPKRMA